MFPSELAKLIPTEDLAQTIKFCRALRTALEEVGASQRGNSPTPTLSVILPLLNEEDNIEALYERLSSVLSSLNESYEILFVDDGSTDHSVKLIESLIQKDSRIGLIELSRNFGQQIAFSAGMDHARGSAVILMDSDLQDTPETIAEFVKRWREGYQVVYATRATRDEGIVKELLYKFFYRLLRVSATIRIPLDAGDFCLMDRKVVDLITSMPERSRFLRGIRSWVGFSQFEIKVDRPSRSSGQAKYSLDKLIALALDGLISFSVRPIRLVSCIGFVVSLTSVLLAAFYLFKRIAIGLTPPGFATIVVMICFFSGIQLITMGLLGEYVGRIFEETKKRPLYVMRRKICR